MNREVTLSDVLAAREARVLRQQRLLSAFHTPVLSFSMNIAGPVKTSPVIERAFRWGSERLLTGLVQDRLAVLTAEDIQAVTGPELTAAVQADALALKRLCVAAEDETPLGRLFDMDVIGTDGQKIDRSAVGAGERGCIVCGKPGRDCASRRLHTVPELQTATARLIQTHFAAVDAAQVANIVTEALLREVYTTPKPGLVDLANTGSHSDMTVQTFEASAEALRPYWRDCMRIGIETANAPAPETFRLLRKRGLEAEHTMLAATGGVNTHKGAIFLLGILCGAVGRLWMAEQPFASVESLCDESAAMTAPVLAEEWESIKANPPKHPTTGQRLYLEAGITGARGESMGGFIIVRKFGLPVYRAARRSGLSENDAAAVTLLYLLANGTDTNMIARGGFAVAARATDAVRVLLQKTPYPDTAQIETLNASFVRQNLSPGGSADLLAVTLFLEKLTNLNE